jgi:hypothetical protein
MHGTSALEMTEAKGTVDRFIPNMRGDTWVLLLIDGTEAHFPPHLSTELAAAIKPGSNVTIRGVRPHGDRVVAAVSLETSDGVRIDAQEVNTLPFAPR